MGNPVATRTRAADSSSPVAARPEPVAETSESVSVVPPVYMSTAESLASASPNYSSVSEDQAGYCESVSEDPSSTSTPETSVTPAPLTSSTAPESAATEDTAGAGGGGEMSGGGEISSTAESEDVMADDATGEGAEASGESSTADAVASGSGESDTEASVDEGEGADADSEDAATTGGASAEEDEGVEAVVTKLPRMAPIRTPWIGSPPPQAIQRRDEIIKRTGSPPELHHAQVRQAVEHVAQAARDAQRRMVWQLGNVAKDTRISLEDMASEILKATSAAIGQINAAIETAIMDVGLVAEDEVAHIEDHGVLTGEDLQRSRDDTTVQLQTYLTQGSADIEALNEVARGRFDNYLGQAEAKVFAIPDTGAVGRIPAPPAASPAASSGDAPHVPQEGERTSDYQLIEHAQEALVSFIDTQSTSAASAVSRPSDNTKNYFSLRATPVMEGMSDRTHTTLVENAQQSAENLSNDATRAQFNILLLGLTTPISEHHEQDQSGTVDANERAIRAQMTEGEYAVRQASLTIYEKRDQAAEYLDLDLRQNLTENIQKTGSKAYKSMMEQAASAEVALNSSAAPMAEGYRDLVDRLNVLVPPGQFLDSRSIVPKLIAARDSAEKMRRSHVEAGEQQSLQTVAQMQDVKKEQVDGILKAGQESADSVQDVVTQTSFDMSMFSSQMTGHLSEGAINSMAAAQEYAAKVAGDILKSVNGTEGAGLNRIDSVAVGFLNGNIGAAEQSQFHTLAAFVEQMEQARNGPLVQPMVDARGNLESRSTELDNKMPERSTATAIGVGLVSPIALGVYLYHTDASESGVIQQLGSLMWPGILALEEVFRGQKHGDLQGRIRDRLGDPEKGQALRLFSTSAPERAEARLEIANGSTAWFTGVNREARDSVLQGMSGEERGSLDPSQITSTREHLQSELSGTTEELSVAYLDGNREAAAAARTHEALDKAQGQGEWGWIFSAESARQRSDQARVDAMANIDETLRSELLIETAFVDQRVIDSRRDQVFREFASFTDPNRRAASSFTLEEARGAMIGYATRSHNAAVIGLNPLGLVVPGAALQVNVERVDMGGDARQFIEDVVNHGTNSTEARNSRGVFEFNRAEDDSGGLGISSNTQVRLTNAFENRDLARLERDVREARTPEARSRAERLLAEERGHHRERMQAMAGRLGAPEDVANDPARAEAWMSERMGGLFATTDTISQAVGLSPSHARYGEEMITGGRASLDAGVALASDGWGTNNDLLRSTYADRSHEEIRAANARWASEHGGENMEEMLGIRQREWTAGDTALMALSPAAWFATRGSETSGDLAMELEVLAQGNPETDLDYINIANLRYRQQRERGTGFISEHTMNGSDEQQYLDGSRERMARTILTEAGRHNPELLARFGDNPSAIFNPDGSINSEVTRAAFNETGEFRGNSSQLQYMSNNIGYAADAYKAEIDRQEAMLTSGITIMALVVSLALMLVPGVNIVAAGIITAIVAGAATMAVKLGMRGGRYGWEEAATDVAQTAIEVATAGIGGAMAGGLGKTGMLARLGETMINRLGRVGGAIAREAIMGAISTAAQTAIQDDVWNDGLARGLQKVANGAIRGAAVSAVTTGISEGITARLNRPINPEISKLTRMDQVAGRLGPHGAEMFREGLTNTLGSIAGESVGVLIDYSQGNFHGTFGDALKHIGMSGLREMVTSSLRGGITSMNRAHYHALLDAARNGGTLNDSQLKALRAFGISSGELHYDQGLEHVRHEVELGRNLLARVPPALREHLQGTDVDSLKQLIGVLAHGSATDIGNVQSENGKFLMGLAEKIPGLNTEQLFAAVGGIINARSPDQATAGLDATQQHQLRNQLAASLDENIRGSLDKIPLDGMQHLSELELSHAAAMIARGQFDSVVADQLMQSAKVRNPQLDEFSFLNNLHAAVSHSAEVQQRMFKAAMERRQEVVALVPQEAARVFAQLGDSEIEQAQKLIRSGSSGTPHERDALFHAALKTNPELTRDQFHGFMESAATRVREQMHSEAQTRRMAREERMAHMPEELRSTLSALPEAALVELRLRQMEGNLSPAEKHRLLEMARRETPDVDLHALANAMEQAVQLPPTHLPSDVEAANMRKQLLGAIPPEQQALIANTKIMVLSADEFIAFTRSQKGQAVTLIINGEPVVIVREGANPRVLREEGIHALQAHDPKWANHIGSLDEHYLSHWDSLPLEQQIALYRNKVALELDAQSRMMHSLETDIENASGAEKHALQQQLEQVRGAFENLSRRNAEVQGIDAADIHNIKAGFSETPQWLEQPARLFNKDTSIETEPVTRVKTEQELRDELVDQFVHGLKPGGEAETRWRQLATNMDLDPLHKLVNANPDARVVRELAGIATNSPQPQTVIDNLHMLAPHIDAAQLASVARSTYGELLLRALADLHVHTPPADRARILALAASDQISGLLLGVDVKGTAHVHVIDTDSIHSILTVSSDSTVAMKLMNIAANSPNSADFAVNLHAVFSALPEADRQGMIATVARKEKGNAQLINDLAASIRLMGDNTILSSHIVNLVIQDNHPTTVIASMNELLGHGNEDMRAAVVTLLEQSVSGKNSGEVLGLLHAASTAPTTGPSLVTHLEHHPQMLSDIIQMAARSAQHFDTLSRLTQIASAVVAHGDPHLLAKLHDYIKAQLAGGDNNLFRSLREMSNIIKDQGIVTPEIIAALTHGTPMVTTRVVADTPANLTSEKAPAQMADPHATPDAATQKAIHDFVHAWHLFMSGDFTVNAKTRPVSESYKDFVGFLVSTTGFGLTDADIHGALQKTIATLVANGEELTVDNIRHGFKEQFKEQILQWVLHGDPATPATQKYNAADPATVAASLRRLELLSNHGLNVKDRANLAEQWHAAYRQSLTGAKLETQPTLHEKDNPEMVGGVVPSTPSTTRKPDFSDPPTLGDVKSHQSSLSDDDIIRLRAYLRAASAEGGAQVTIKGALSEATYDRVNVVFTNVNGVQESAAKLVRLLNDYDNFSFSFFNPHTGVRETIDVARLQTMGVNPPYTADALTKAIAALTVDPHAKV